MSSNQSHSQSHVHGSRKSARSRTLFSLTKCANLLLRRHFNQWQPFASVSQGACKSRQLAISICSYRKRSKLKLTSSRARTFGVFSKCLTTIRSLVQQQLEENESV